MEIKVLGSGSRGNCYHITDGETPLLLECGLTFKEIQRGIGFTVSELGGCLISHEHMDHAEAVYSLLKAGVDVYTSEGTAAALGISGHRVNAFKAWEVEAKVTTLIGSWVVLPFETEHDAAEPLGFLLASRTGEKLLYTGDTCYLRHRFTGLSHVMVECNNDWDTLRQNVENGTVDRQLKNRIVESHFSLEHVKEFLKATDLSTVKEIWLLHLSNDNSDEMRFKREIQELTGKAVYVA